MHIHVHDCGLRGFCSLGTCVAWVGIFMQSVMIYSCMQCMAFQYVSSPGGGDL